MRLILIRMAIQLSIGESVRAAMRSAHISQYALAHRLKLSQTAVSRRLAGDVEFSVPELIATAGLLGIPATQLAPALAFSPSTDASPASAEGDFRRSA